MMNTTRNRADLWRCLAVAAAIAASSAEALELSFPPGTRQTFSGQDKAGAYRLPIGPWVEGTGVPVAILEGQIARSAWQVPGTGVTTQETMAALRTSLQDAGYKVIFECEAVSCGGFDFRFETEVLKAPDMYVDISDYRFLAARSESGASALGLLVSRNGSEIFVQLIEVAPPGAPTIGAHADNVPLNPVADLPLVAQLEQAGHVVLEDLTFASGSSALDDGPKPSLDELAAYLLSRPDREIVFVGHTDAVGSLESNIQLSRKRAVAVRDFMIGRHGVPAEQVAADGVGFLAPRASNLTPEGRKANRRVEAVLISTK